MLSIKSPNDMSLELATKARKLRLQEAWSREELASRSGVSAASIKRFETTGQIALERLLQICFTLGCLGDFEKVMEPAYPKSMKEIKARANERQRGRRRKSS